MAVTSLDALKLLHKVAEGGKEVVPEGELETDMESKDAVVVIDPMGDPVMVPMEVGVISVEIVGIVEPEGETELVSKEEGLVDNKAEEDIDP